MTVQEIKDAIRIKAEPEDDLTDVLTATFQIHYSVRIRKDYTNNPAARSIAEEELKYNILRALFDDSRRAMAEALENLHLANPMNYAQYREAVDAVYAAARFQKREMNPLPETIS